MAMNNFDRVIYQLRVEDLHRVANDILDRELTENEIKLLEDKIGDYINWYESIQSAILQNIK